MGFSTILLLIFIVILGVSSYIFLMLNNKIISVDLLFISLDIEIGQIILFATLLGILISTISEILFFSSRRRKKDE
tara:strand:- start:1819 stop:2046 length:228 start_codon:yes stop_codon:yes gene_type:complete